MYQLYILILLLISLAQSIPIPSSLYASIDKPQLEEIKLLTFGTIPLVNGTLFRNGYGKFEGKGFVFNHLFDAMALLLSFRIENGHVFYQSRFIDSNYYNDSLTLNEMPPRTFGGTFPSCSNNSNLNDNRNGNIVPWGNYLLAINDMPGGIIIGPNLTRISFIQPLIQTTIMSTPHPLFHPPTKSTYSIELVANEGYYIIQTDEYLHTTILGILKTDQPGFIHSFSLTEHFLILVEYPVTWSIRELLDPDPLLSAFQWNEQEQTKIHCIDLLDKSVKTFFTPSFFAFHHVNAYEESVFDEIGKTRIVLDIIIYDNIDILNQLSLQSLLKNTNPPGGTLCRYFLSYVPVADGDDDDDDLFIATQKCYPNLGLVEMPAINPDFRMKNYEIAYFLRGHEIVQFNFSTSSVVKLWSTDNHQPSEVVMVKQGYEETNGTLLTLVYDATNNISYLLFLNAENLKETGRAVTHRIPLTCHGFFQNLN